MDFLTLFLAICFINAALYFIDLIIKKCSNYPYFRFLHGNGFNVGILRITWYTRIFNRFLQKCSTYMPKIIDIWFSIGVYVTIILLPISYAIVMFSIRNVFNTKSLVDEDDVGLILEPVFPGVNLPVADLGYYFFTITVCSIFHEMGHAIAALRENVQVSGVGFVAFIMVPIAYVKLNTEQFTALEPMKQLRIFSAGIWNNVASTFAAYMCLLFLPVLFSPFYELGRGVTVMNINQNSQIAGIKGLEIGDKLIAINDCEVSGMETWHRCLESFKNNPPPGFCIDEETIRELDQSVPLAISEDGTVECCEKTKEKHLCFETLDDGHPLQTLQYSCLPGRKIVANSAYMCSIPKDCPPNLHCLRPVTPQGMTLLRFQRSQGNVVIFVGKPDHVLQTVQVTEYGRSFNMFPPELAEGMKWLTKYILLFSSGMAILNTFPCFYFDGYHITYAVVDYLFQRFPNRHFISLFLNLFGTTLLIINFSAVIWKLTKN